MQNTSPATRYGLALSAGDYQPDKVQENAVNRLDDLYHALIARAESFSAQPKGFMARISQRLNKNYGVDTVSPIRGLYLWGGVGRGKTWLMDMFYQSLPGDRKLRLHFHRFILRVHEELRALQGYSDPLEKVADDFKAQTDVLCFDEFFVSDITDAMLLGGLMQALFARGITLVATSNIPPDQLYRNGLQRARFLPAIEAIKTHCDVVNVDAGIDYRLRTLTQAHLWLFPLEEATNAKMRELWHQLAGGALHAEILEINHRPFQTSGSRNQTLAVSFQTVCVQPRSPGDYIVLSHQYHTVLLSDVPVMNVQMESEARRFIAVIDEFYERHVKLIISAAAPMMEIYRGTQLKFEFQRCLSRLQEMQSEEYLRLEHQP